MHISQKFATDLATAASTMTTIAIALLAFLADRTRARSRTQLGSYAASLVGLMVLAFYAAASDGIAWWAWTRASETNTELLFGWHLLTWLWILFVPPLAFSAGVFLICEKVLVRQATRKIRERPSP